MSLRTLPMGRSAVIVDDPPGAPAAWSAAFRSLGLAGVIDVVPAARTVLIVCADPGALERAVARFDDVPVGGVTTDAVATVVLPVVYDGADLDAVAATTGLRVDEVVALHTGAEYEVAFCGFAPGFGYLRGLPGALHLPRLATPRTSVPAGSVGIAAEYSAVYPVASPGGWNLLGSTRTVMFDPDRSPPALLAPGTRVRFVER